VGPETDLVAIVGLALFHAATHLGLHEAKESIERFINRPELLRNHDLREAIQKAIRVTAGRLHDAYRRLYPGESQGLALLKGLTQYVLANGGGEVSFPHDWLSTEHAASTVHSIVESLCPSSSPQLKEFVQTHFPPLFVFAFREIGLKANSKVRAVIFESMLQRLISEDQKIEAMLVASDEALQAGLQSMGYEITLMRGEVAQLLHELRGFKVLIDLGLLGEGPILAYVRIDDPQGLTIRTEAVRNRKLTIGRGSAKRGLAIHLDDGSVSRQHCAITLDDEAVIVEDLKSRHGTFVAGQRVVDPLQVNFGAVICVGPFRLAILSPQAPARELMTDPTQPN
jgi:hypothetical protein